MQQDPINQLRKEVIQQKAAHLPKPTHCELCLRAFEQLETFDAFVAQVVIQALQGHPQNVVYPQQAELDVAFGQLAASSDAEDIRQFRLLQNARQRLEKMLDLVNRAASLPPQEDK